MSESRTQIVRIICDKIYIVNKIACLRYYLHSEILEPLIL